MTRIMGFLAVQREVPQGHWTGWHSWARPRMAHDDAVLAILQSADGPTTAPVVAALIAD